MNFELERIIHILNPWLTKPNSLREEIIKKLPSNYIKRKIIDEQAYKWNDASKIHLIIGTRQVGKSTVIWKYLEENKKRVLFLNCEEPLIIDWCTSSALFFDDVKELLKQIDVIFFEEAQNLNNAGLFFKGLIDLKLGIPILVTGSSSYHLHSKTRESLAGRATRYTMTQFSLEELTPPPFEPSMASWKKIAKDIIEKQICFGSYPAVWFSENKENELYDLIEAFIIRDASDLFKIKYVNSFRQLLKLISWQIGNLVNYSEWSGIIGVDNNTTKHYVEILEETGIVKIIYPYVGGKRAEITSSPNVYFADTGLRNAFERRFLPLDERSDRGPLFENWVVAELSKILPHDVDIKFWRTKSGSEADFVLLQGMNLAGMEVKCTALDRGKISKSSRSFIEAYNPKYFYIINRGYEGEENISNTKVMYLKPESILKIKEKFGKV